MNVLNLARFLSSFHNQDLAQYLIAGFTHGFDIGFTGSFSDSRPANLRSAIQASEAVSTAISTEVKRGHTAGPFVAAPFTNFHCSPLGAVPKSNGSIRLILDLSSPRSQSVNEGIPPEIFSMTYSRFDDAVNMVRNLGPSCFMAKVDIKHAFRLVPVRPQDYPLLGFHWNNKFYFDLRLSFGSRSSPCIFNNFADALCYILATYFGVKFIVHYLDDYFLANFMAEASSSSCQLDVEAVLKAFDVLGIPVAIDKLVHPTQCLTYLGIEIDAVSMTIRLPNQKLVELIAELRSWERRSN